MIKKIEVFYSGWGEHWNLGTLADNGKLLLFEYSAEALNQGLELSPLHLKLAAQAYGDFPTHQMRLPGLIADSLPDGWGLLLMDKLFRKQGLKIENISPLDRLSFIGDRAMGALNFKPASSEDFEAKNFTLLEMAEEVQKVIEGPATESLTQLAMLGGSPHGVRPKLVLDYDRKTGKISTHPSHADNRWLIKFPTDREHKEVCAVEALYAHLARKAGLKISEVEYFDLSKSLSAFGTRRFDVEDGLRIPTHTLAGILNADFRIPSSVDYLSFLKVIRLMTRDEGEVLRGFRQCAFNVIFNNRDDHSKNFSFLLDRKRNWKLSPPMTSASTRDPVENIRWIYAAKGKLQVNQIC